MNSIKDLLFDRLASLPTRPTIITHSIVYQLHEHESLPYAEGNQFLTILTKHSGCLNFILFQNVCHQFCLYIHETFFHQFTLNITILSLNLSIHNPLRHIPQNMFLHLPTPRLRHLTKAHLLVAQPKNVCWRFMPSHDFSDPRFELLVCRFTHSGGSCQG